MKTVSQLEQAIQECGNCDSLPTLHKNLGLIECRAGQLAKARRNSGLQLPGCRTTLKFNALEMMIGNMSAAAANRPH